MTTPLTTRLARRGLLSPADCIQAALLLAAECQQRHREAQRAEVREVAA